MSSRPSQTSTPTCDLARASCSDRSLPCMRHVLPIICSGREPRAGGPSCPAAPIAEALTVPPARAGRGGHPSRRAAQLAPGRLRDHATLVGRSGPRAADAHGAGPPRVRLLAGSHADLVLPEAAEVVLGDDHLAQPQRQVGPHQFVQVIRLLVAVPLAAPLRPAAAPAHVDGMQVVSSHPNATWMARSGSWSVKSSRTSRRHQIIGEPESRTQQRDGPRAHLLRAVPDDRGCARRAVEATRAPTPPPAS